MTNLRPPPESDTLRTVDWVKDQLGHQRISSTYRWLRKRGIRPDCGFISERSFFDNWRLPSRRAHVRSVVDRNLRMGAKGA